MSPGASSEASTHPARCVLVHHPAESVPEGLLSALVRRGIEVSGCSGAHRAMAMLCALTGEAEDAPLILLLVEPSRIRLAAALIDAAELYLPSVTCWMYVDDGSPQLRAVEPSDLEAWGRAAPVAAADTNDSGMAGPALKLVDPDDEPGGGGGSRTPVKPTVPKAREAQKPRETGADGSENDGDPGSGSGEDGSPESSVESPVALTDEELSMLLADEWRDEDRS
jgi:hypothetical protein